MDPSAGVIGQAGLQFFGKMCASISHDIKNVLAVINENAGLLEDLCLMAEKGRPIEPVRLKRLAGDVQEQIRRGDRIVTGMNRFAHSADAPNVDVDLSEMADLLAALAVRFAAANGVRVQVMSPSRGKVRITTSPFMLLNLMWLCLDGAMASAGPGRTIGLAVEDGAEGGRLRFRGLQDLDRVRSSLFSAAAFGALCSSLKAEMSFAADGNEMSLLLPIHRG